jgi:hypothetical protein
VASRAVKECKTRLPAGFVFVRFSFGREVLPSSPPPTHPGLSFKARKKFPVWRLILLEIGNRVRPA